MTVHTFQYRLGEACAYYQKHTKRTIDDLCKAVGISKGKFFRLKRGDSLPTIDDVFSLAQELSCPVTWLLGTELDLEGEPFSYDPAPWEEV